MQRTALRIRYKQNPNQTEFHNDFKSKQMLLTSGYGGGKSYALCMKALKLSQLNRPYTGGMFAPSIPEYKRDLLPIMLEILEENRIDFDYHKTDKVWSFPWTPGKIIVFTCEKRIRGPNLAFACINEPGLIDYDRFKEILGRVRIKGAPFRQIVLAGTPEGRSNWLYEHFVDQGKGRVIYGDTRQNPYLSEDYVETLRENYDEIMLQSYLEGKFVNLNSAMFYYAFSREKNFDKTLKRNPDLETHIGMDFNVDYMSASLWHCDDTSASAHGEIVLVKNQDTHKMCRAILARGYNPRGCTVYPDTAGKSRDTRGNISDIQILESYGFKVRYKPRAPYFRDRQLAVNNLLDKRRIKINPDACPLLVRDFEDVEQDTGDYSKIKTNQKLTHLSDGVDYMIDIMYPIAGTKPVHTTRR